MYIINTVFIWTVSRVVYTCTLLIQSLYGHSVKSCIHMYIINTVVIIMNTVSRVVYTCT